MRDGVRGQSKRLLLMCAPFKTFNRHHDPRERLYRCDLKIMEVTSSLRVRSTITIFGHQHLAFNLPSTPQSVCYARSEGSRFNEAWGFFASFCESKSGSGSREVTLSSRRQRHRVCHRRLAWP